MLKTNEDIAPQVQSGGEGGGFKFVPLPLNFCSQFKLGKFPNLKVIKAVFESTVSMDIL